MFAAVFLCLPCSGALFAQEASTADSQPGAYATPEVFSESSYDKEAFRAAPRDAFPVLDHPTLVAAAEANLQLQPEEPVIGIFIGGEARAYPISVMGGVELVNDHCGEIPIAISW